MRRVINRFVFDVDGTLTPSRRTIDPEFKKFFNDFCRNNPVYLITGSDRPKTIEQIGKDTYDLCYTVYQCNGNDVWRGDKNIRKNDWHLKEKPHRWLSKKLTESEFSLRTGLHFEHRHGMCNFSIVGRNATLGERKLYIEWDTKTNERTNIAESFNGLFPMLEAKVGGETGIDISMKGLDKSQIMKDFDEDDEVWFFGDKCDEGGNDYPLAQVADHSRHVTGWQQTMEYLGYFQDRGIAQ